MGFKLKLRPQNLLFCRLLPKKPSSDSWVTYQKGGVGVFLYTLSRFRDVRVWGIGPRPSKHPQPGPHAPEKGSRSGLIAHNRTSQARQTRFMSLAGGSIAHMATASLVMLASTLYLQVHSLVKLPGHAQYSSTMPHHRWLHCSGRGGTRTVLSWKLRFPQANPIPPPVGLCPLGPRYHLLSSSAHSSCPALRRGCLGRSVCSPNSVNSVNWHAA